MHQDEKWQVYAPNGEPIPGLGRDSALGNPETTEDDEIVGVAVVFLYRMRDGGLEFLWQKRSEKVDRYPGDYDISAGGHINLGESLVEAAIREAREEIGAEITADELQYVTMIPFNKNRFAWVYAVDYTGREEDFAFNDEEVSEVRWVPYEKMEEFRKEFAKLPLKKDELTFLFLDRWLKMHGLVDNRDGFDLENYAFIDGQNLIYNTARREDEPWKIDLRRFRVYLRDKYQISTAYYFIGAYNERYEKMYRALNEYGYELVFREHDGKSKSSKKGNVDTDIVFSAMKKIAEREQFDKILLVSDDGDYWRMVNYLIKKGKFKKLLAPSRKYVSYLYKVKTKDTFVDYLDKAEIKKKIALEEDK